MYQLVTIGDITIDTYFQGETLTQEKDRFSFVIGGKYYVDYFYSGLGGSAANVAIHGAHLGLDSAAAALVGENAFKNMIVQGLAKKTVSTEFLHFESKHISISSILLTPTGERTIIKYSDPKEHVYLSEHAIERIQKSGIVFMGNLPDVPVQERADLLKKVRSDSNITAINFGSKDCENGADKLKKLIDSVDVLILNRYEFAALIKKKADSLDLSKNHYKALGCQPGVIVVTDGAKGSHAYTEDESFSQNAVEVKKVVDATGAGDSFTAAFLKVYSEQKNIQQALEFASEYVAKVIVKIGAN